MLHAVAATLVIMESIVNLPPLLPCLLSGILGFFPLRPSQAQIPRSAHFMHVSTATLPGQFRCTYKAPWQKIVQLPLQSPLLCLPLITAAEAWERSLLACWARAVGLSCTWISQYLLPSWFGTAPAPPAGWASTLHLITFAQPDPFKHWRQSW